MAGTDVPSRPLLVAGATGYGRWPANSLQGARRCLAQPIDGIEIDVQLTADGHVVAHHDYRLNPDQARINGEWLKAPSAPLKTLSLDELRAYDLGRSRPGSGEALRHPLREDMDGVTAPTLPEILETLSEDRPRRWLYVEVKTSPQNPADAPAPGEVVEAVFRDLEAFGYVEHAKIIAFDWRVLRLSVARSPGVATAHLTIPAALVRTVKLGADGRSPWTDGVDRLDHQGSDLKAIKAHGGMEWSPHFTEVTAERMYEAEGLGLRVGPWGLARGEDIRRMAELGVYSSTVSGASWGK